MKVLTRDELRDMARPTHQKITERAAQVVEKARAEIAIATLLRTNISPVVPIAFWHLQGLHAKIGIRTLPLALANAKDMIDAHPPAIVTQLTNGNAKPTASLTDRDREDSYRDVASFYIRAQYDLYRSSPSTDARLCWWSYLLGDEFLIHFEVPLAASEEYLICQYATDTPRSKKAHFNSARTRLPNPQVQRYSGGNTEDPKYFYLHWDMRTSIHAVIDGIQEDWHVC